MQKPEIQFYDIPTLEEIATTFLKKYNDPEVFPVDIEFILEEQLGWNIVGWESLTENYYGIEAFLTNGKTIYIDSYLMNHKERKYRFTLAEELSHFILHKDIYAKCRSLEEHLEIYDNITTTEYWRMDRNAKYLASAILMPSASFEKQANLIYDKVDRKIYSTNEQILYKMTLQLSNDFNVNDIASRIRFKNLGLHRKFITL